MGQFAITLSVPNLEDIFMKHGLFSMSKKSNRTCSSSYEILLKNMCSGKK